jgi:hypothetical protein
VPVCVCAATLGRNADALDQDGAKRPELIDLLLLLVHETIQFLHQVFLMGELDLDLD